MAERFAQGRVAFVFNLTEVRSKLSATCSASAGELHCLEQLDAPGSELPATLLRSVSTEDAADVVLCAVDAPLLLKAGETVGRLRLAEAGAIGKKLRRKEKLHEPAAAPAPKVRPAPFCFCCIAKF